MMKFVRFLITLQVAACCSRGAMAASTTAESPTRPLDYFIVVTGGELLQGVYPDGHTHFITRTLLPIGCHCVGSMSVDDRAGDIKQALAVATNRAPLVLVTGGLGPTPNDITRETLAEFTGISLREHPEVLAGMERRFNHTRDQLRPNLRRQTLVPSRGGYLKNPNGTAVGLVFDDGAQVIVALPGPPRELQPMVKEELMPFLGRRFGVRSLGCSATLRFVGVGQSFIDQSIRDKIRVPADVVVTSLFEGSRVDFTFTLPGNSAEDQRRLRDLKRRVHDELGDYLYGEDGATLESVVLASLRARGGTLTLVEVASGGQVAAGLSGAPEAARLVAGAFAAPTVDGACRLLAIPAEVRSQWAPGGEVVKGLAESSASHIEAQWALVVGPLETDPKTGKCVWMALRFPDGKCETAKLPGRDSGEIARGQLVNQVLDQVRRWLR